MPESERFIANGYFMRSKILRSVWSRLDKIVVSSFWRMSIVGSLMKLPTFNKLLDVESLKEFLPQWIVTSLARITSCKTQTLLHQSLFKNAIRFYRSFCPNMLSRLSFPIVFP